jgi:hypothetical protein
MNKNKTERIPFDRQNDARNQETVAIVKKDMLRILWEHL